MHGKTGKCNGQFYNIQDYNTRVKKAGPQGATDESSGDREGKEGHFLYHYLQSTAVLQQIISATWDSVVPALGE